MRAEDRRLIGVRFPAESTDLAGTGARVRGLLDAELVRERRMIERALAWRTPAAAFHHPSIAMPASVSASTRLRTRSPCARARPNRGPAAHRLPDDVRALDTEMIEDREQIAGRGARIRETVVVRRETEAALVPGDDAVVAREHGNLLEPDRVVAARAVTEHDDRRVGRAERLEVHVVAVARQEAVRLCGHALPAARDPLVEMRRLVRRSSCRDRARGARACRPAT